MKIRTFRNQRLRAVRIHWQKIPSNDDGVLVYHMLISSVCLHFPHAYAFVTKTRHFSFQISFSYLSTSKYDLDYINLYEYIGCTPFCAGACSVLVKAINTGKVDGNEKRQMKSVNKSRTNFDCLIFNVLSKP